MATKKERRDARINKLLAAGFSKSDANKLRDKSDKNVAAAIRDKKREDRNAERREKYKTAIEKGLTPREAKEARSFGKIKTEIIKDSKITPESKESFWDWLKKIPKDEKDAGLFIPEVTDVRAYHKWFLEPHSYVMEFNYTNGEVDWVTVTSIEPLTGKELKNTVLQIFEDKGNQAKAKYAKEHIMAHTISCIEYIYNPFANQGAKKSMQERKKTKVRQRKEKLLKDLH